MSNKEETTTILNESNNAKCIFFKKRKKANDGSNKRKKNEDDEEEADISIEKIDSKKRRINTISTESKFHPEQIIEDDEIEFKNQNAIDSNRSKESIKVSNDSVEENRSENSALSKFNQIKKLSENTTNEEGKKLYKGEKAYHQYISKNENQIRASKYTGTMGPVNAPTNIRATTVIDYVQELCRDYKETGYCTFGDSCKFIHDRGDYKSGWELDKEWEEKEEKKRKAMLRGEVYNSDEEDKKYEIEDSSDEDENDIPSVCGICGKELVNAVMTNCKHYFCRNCALKRYSKNKSCGVCGKATDGSFNVVKDIIELRKQRMKDNE